MSENNKGQSQPVERGLHVDVSVAYGWTETQVMIVALCFTIRSACQLTLIHRIEWYHLHCADLNTTHGNEVLPQDTTHLIQRPCYQRESSCQDPAGNRTTRRPPDHRKETQTAVVWSCLPYIRSGQNYLARHSERRKKTRQTEEEVGRQHQVMDRPGVRQVPEGSGEQ